MVDDKQQFEDSLSEIQRKFEGLINVLTLTAFKFPQEELSMEGIKDLTNKFKNCLEGYKELESYL